MMLEAIDGISRSRGIFRGRTDGGIGFRPIAVARCKGGSSRGNALEPAPAELICKIAQIGKQPGGETEFGSEAGDGVNPRSGLAPIRSRIGARSASMAPRLSDRSMRPDLSTRSKYSAAVIGRMPRRWESD